MRKGEKKRREQNSIMLKNKGWGCKIYSMRSKIVNKDEKRTSKAAELMQKTYKQAAVGVLGLFMCQCGKDGDDGDWH